MVEREEKDLVETQHKYRKDSRPGGLIADYLTESFQLKRAWKDACPVLKDHSCKFSKHLLKGNQNLSITKAG